MTQHRPEDVFARKDELLGQPVREVGEILRRIGNVDRTPRLASLLRRYPLDGGDPAPQSPVEAATLEANMARELHAVFIDGELLADAIEDPSWLMAGVQTIFPDASAASITRAYLVAAETVAADMAEAAAIAAALDAKGDEA